MPRSPLPDVVFDFPPEARLKTRRDFDRVFAEGRKVVNRQLVVWIASATGSRSRVGLMVSRKVGDSPCRSRTKRLLREAFRHLSPDIAEPLEFVLLARPGAAPRTLDEARSALEDILRRHAKGQGSAPGEGARGRRGGSAKGKPKAGPKRDPVLDPPSQDPAPPDSPTGDEGQAARTP